MRRRVRRYFIASLIICTLMNILDLRKDLYRNHLHSMYGGIFSESFYYVALGTGKVDNIIMSEPLIDHFKVYSKKGT